MYGYSMDQYNFDNFIIYNIKISQPLHLHHLQQYSLCQLLQDAEGASRTDIIGMNLL